MSSTCWAPLGRLFVTSVAVLGLLGARPAAALELITNGDFEAGTVGWLADEQPGSSGAFVLDNADGFTPISGRPTVGPAGGNFYAVSDQTAAGATALLQPFTVPTNAPKVILSFDMFVNDWSNLGPIVHPAGLDFTAVPNQHARVDLLVNGAPGLDTGAAVLRNFYLGVDVNFENINDYTHYSFDITPQVKGGGTFLLRFAEVDNQSFLNQGVDNVSIAVVPEPASLALLSAGVLPLLRRRRQSVDMTETA
jgi:hypothetical protein